MIRTFRGSFSWGSFTKDLSVCIAVSAVILVSIPANTVMAANVLTSAMQEFTPTEALVLEGADRYGRGAVYTDIIGKALVSGEWTSPKEGDSVVTEDGKSRNWEKIAIGQDGWFSREKSDGGYIYIPIESDTDRVMIAHIKGGSMFYINGQPRTANRYQLKDVNESWEPTFDFVQLPVALRKGTNDLLFRRAGRSAGRIKMRLFSPKSEVMFNTTDSTLPDLVVAEPAGSVGAVVVVNASDKKQDNLYIKVTWPAGKECTSKLPAIGPMTVRKTGFDLVCESFVPDKPQDIKLGLTLMRRDGQKTQQLDTAEITLHVKDPYQPRKCTFISDIDGSVQYYALTAAKRLTGDNKPAGLVLSVHGANVEAINQASSYNNKTWCDIVAPTNRRPYGFDWEDWGRMDALEVLETAKAKLKSDPGRIYLTGHSMGGHGTWILGSQFPDKFAAIGPSAGWISFLSYRGGQRYEDSGTIEQVLNRAASAGDTITLSKNLKDKGVYIIHGSTDDNVPVGQAEMMVKNLEKFHRDFVFHNEPGQSHWWDLSDEPGTDCVDLPQLFDFFARHYLPSDDAVRIVDFTTVNPGISAWSHWVSIEAQKKAMESSNANIRFDPGMRRFVGKTENVERICFKLDHLPAGTDIAFDLDGQKIPAVASPAGTKQLWLEHKQDKWSVIGEPAKSLKGPHRCGPFKDAFKHRMVFVYGTGGTPQENEWSYNKARFDSEQFWYTGNGSIDIVSDADFDPAQYKDRGVIIYGNSQTNKAWKLLLASSPVQVDGRTITTGARKLEGDGLACLFIRPRLDSDIACVAVVSGTGIKGMRLTDRLPYLLASCSYPDFIAFGQEMLAKGTSGVEAAGFFGNDWTIETGYFVYREDQKDTQKPDQSDADASKDSPQENQKEKKEGTADIKNPAAQTVAKENGPDPRPFVMPRSYICQRTLGPITVDGKLDEPSWQKAPWTQYHVDIEGQMRPVEPRYKTHVKMLWDDQYLYIAAELEEPHVWATITQRNAVIYNDNDFEIFIDPDGDNHQYYEFETNALNTVWNLFLDKPYKNGGNATVREMPDQKNGVFVDGTINNPSDTDRRWTLEVAFPWKAMAEYAHRPCPPANGDQWRMNFSRVEWGHKIVDGKYTRVPSPQERTDNWHEDNWIWSPQGVINMHRPETWGYVRFSSKPAGSKDIFTPDPTAVARYLLHKVHYAQEEFKSRKGTYAAAIEQLNLGPLEDKSLAAPITMQSDQKGYTAAAKVKLDNTKTATLTIDSAGRLVQK